MMATSTLKTYAGYTRCEHCGIYDSDTEWCDLCGSSKHGGKNSVRAKFPVFAEAKTGEPESKTGPRA